MAQLVDDGWSEGVCPAEPGLPKLLLLSLEHVGVTETPEYYCREFTTNGTRRCRMFIFVEKSSLYKEVAPWFVYATSYDRPNAYRKAARKALMCLRVLYKQYLVGTAMGFAPPLENGGREWI